MKNYSWAALSLGLCALATAAQANDLDGDGIVDLADNCLEVANADQRDTDGDLFGNRCDADFNNDGRINFIDLLSMRSVFFAKGDLVQDLDGDNQVNFADLQMLKGAFFGLPGPSGAAAANATAELLPVFTSLSTGTILSMHQAPSDSSQWYIGERTGRILRFDNVESPAGADPVLDITDRVDTFFEGGLLGFAFHPNYSLNGHVFVSYTTTGDDFLTNPLDSRISRFTRSATNPQVLDPDSEVVVIEVDQPYGNHNGGDLAFDDDGYLYWGLGDGGLGNDPLDAGQDITNLLSGMLRIDIDVSEQQIAAGTTYLIPDDNPMAKSLTCATGCPELYAWGFRNPYRFSFDQLTDELYAGDVGQSAREEIDLVVNGGNYGWSCYEGNLVFSLLGCLSPENYVFPLIDYPRTVGTSVTGGYVYRGSNYPQLNGVYLYGDFGSGEIWGLVGGKPLGELVNTTLSLVTFAQGNDGEVYVIDFPFGNIYRIGVAQ